MTKATSEEEELGAVRNRIDAIDQELLALISERARCAQQVAHIKTAATDRSVQFYRPERESAILRRIKDANPGPLDGEEVARLFREIMSACLALERPLNAAFLGPEGTFTQAAAIKHFGHSVVTKAMGTIDEIFREVESDTCDFGVVPVENSTEGVVSHTLDLFMTSPLMITGEVCLRIHHHLLSHAEDLGAIGTVYSHQQSLAQCREWLDRNLPTAERVAVGSNAEAARLAAQEPNAAAVAGVQAAEIYDLKVLAERIEDEPSNTTRFLVIGKQDSPPSGQDKTSLLLSCQNESGGLHSLLAPMAVHGISMTRIESRPSRRGIWDYVFFVDIIGHRSDPNVAYALQSLEKDALLFKVLGSYPIAVL
ncbi:prephenate dehydratase [Thiorhodococcus mannitoliphagus]|uniref:Bifunctional chorismate mutase/prephenate dehydratase n=1 Tax=Thiorhodococcus mannitoliphagus TaxID=329406 RepID=A0A6P1E0X6_9GAMM|nr:prephenate dehydratase [Thiorhodococcus mannitoliphagus]NEX21395.1 prephenate dehydratase [Thiorhodococcus mannitoliphagus]